MKEINAQSLLLKLLDGTTIKGKTNVGSHQRLSDCLNREESPFLVVFDVSMQGQAGKVLFINKSQIMWAMPVE
jgi:hypothetical protein